MIYFLITIALLSILSVIIALILTFKLSGENKYKTTQVLQNLFDTCGFFAHKILYVNKNLSLAINKDFTKLAVVENFNPNFIESFVFSEIATSFIYQIEKNNFNLKINYVKRGDKNTIYIAPVTKEALGFFYEIFKKENVKKIENKFPTFNFTINCTSDWNCSYVWTYCPTATTFAYCSTTPNQQFGLVNLRKTFFTIDTKYNYFEIPFPKIRRHLLMHETDFLDKLLKNLFLTIKQKAGMIKKDLIYYDNYNNILYISNGFSSLQSLLLDEIEEIFYKENRLYFTLYDKNQPSINSPATRELITGVEEFITGYNLRKIAHNFDYKSDKLINTTENTKFIIDMTRDRIIYCANLNKLAQFSYLTIPFNNITEISIEKSINKPFVRILTTNKEALDVSCSKSEIAHYITGTLNRIIHL